MVQPGSKKRFQSVGHKQVLFILVCTVILTSLLSVANLIGDYRAELISQEDTIRQIKKSNLEPISRQVWNMDSAVINHIRALRSIEGIEAVWLSSPSGKPLLGTHPPDFRQPDWEERTWPLRYRDERAGRLGTLHLMVSRDAIMHKITKKVSIILGSKALEIFVISLLILLIIRHFIIRHLQTMAAWLNDLDFSSERNPALLELNRLPGQKEDELDLLSDALNKMARKVVGYNRKRAANLEEKNRLEARLLDLNRKLADQVQSKSLELEQVHKELLERAYQSGMAEIATGIIHNISNLMFSISLTNGHIREAIRGGKEQDPAVRQQQILGHCERVQKLLAVIDQTLQTFQKVQTGQDAEMQTSDLRDEIQEVVTLFETTMEKAGIALNMEINRTRTVNIHKFKVIHILINLFKNAMGALEDNPRNDRHIEISISHTAADVRLSFSDNGCGIAKDKLTSVFDFGFTTKESGHGFGLHSCRTYMEEMGGSIEVVSAGSGSGTTFLLIWPKQQQKETA